MKRRKLIAWAIVDKDDDLIKWKCLSDDDEGLEIHATRARARAGRMAGERVKKVLIEVVE